MSAAVAMGSRYGSEEVAAAVAWLLSDAASLINGATVPVDGGRSVLGQGPEARSPEP